MFSQKTIDFARFCKTVSICNIEQKTRDYACFLQIMSSSSHNAFPDENTVWLRPLRRIPHRCVASGVSHQGALKDEVVRRQVHVPHERNLEVGAQVVIHVAGDDGSRDANIVSDILVAELPRCRKLRPDAIPRHIIE